MIFKPAQNYMDENKLPKETIDYKEEASWFRELLWGYFDGPPQASIEHDIYEMTGEKTSTIFFKDRESFNRFLSEIKHSDSLYELGSLSGKYTVEDCIIDVGHSDMSVKVKGWI